MPTKAQRPIPIKTLRETLAGLGGGPAAFGQATAFTSSIYALSNAIDELEQSRATIAELQEQLRASQTTTGFHESVNVALREDVAERDKRIVELLFAVRPFAEAWSAERERWVKAEAENDGDPGVIERWADCGLEFSQTGLTWNDLRRAARAVLEPTEQETK